MTNEYPAGYIVRIKIIDFLAFLIGLALLAIPAIHRFFPGDIDTSVHVAMGALVAVCAIFRVMVAWGSLWLEIVLAFLGFLTMRLPAFMHMQYDPHYNTVHLALGCLLMALAVISGLMTFFELQKSRRTV